jgi:hypothetical protein
MIARVVRGSEFVVEVILHDFFRGGGRGADHDADTVLRQKTSRTLADPAGDH